VKTNSFDDGGPAGDADVTEGGGAGGDANADSGLSSDEDSGYDYLRKLQQQFEEMRDRFNDWMQDNVFDKATKLLNGAQDAYKINAAIIDPPDLTALTPNLLALKTESLDAKLKNFETLDTIRKVGSAYVALRQALHTGAEVDKADAQQKIVSVTLEVAVAPEVEAISVVGNTPVGNFLERMGLNKLIEPGVEDINSAVTDIRLGRYQELWENIQTNTLLLGLRVVEQVQDTERLFFPKRSQ
jgi:hypothetical protein